MNTGDSNSTQPADTSGSDLESEVVDNGQLEEELSKRQRDLAEARELRALLSEDLAAVQGEIGQIRNLIASTVGSFPFVVEQRVARDAKFDGIKLSSYPGLHYVQMVQTDASGKLITVWEREQAFQAHGDRLAQDFGISPPDRTPEFSGTQRTALVAHASFLRRLWSQTVRYSGYPVALIALVAGVLSHFNTIIDLGSQYTVPPKITVVSGKVRLPVGVGQRFSTDFELQNESSFGSSYIHLETAEIINERGQKDTQGIVLDQFKSKIFPLVKPAEAKTVNVAGRAIRPGVYTLKIAGFYTPLYRNFSQTFTEAREIEVWESASVQRLKEEPYRGDKGCKVHFRIRTGQVFANGLVFSAELLKVPGVEFDGVKLPGVFQWDSPPRNPTPGKEAARVTWHTKRLESFDLLEGYVILKTTDDTTRTAAQWKTVSGNVTFGSPVEP